MGTRFVIHNLIDTGYINNKTIIKIINYFILNLPHYL